MSKIQFKNNWEETQQRFDAWFRREKTGRPLINGFTLRDPGEIPGPKLEELPFDDDTDLYLNADKRFARCYNFYQYYKNVGEGFPNMSMDLGAGSIALYLGSEPVFKPDTVWFSHCIEEYDQALPLRYDPENRWLKKHLEIIRRAVELAKDTDIMINIPDLIENIDILAAMRDPQTCCYDLYDYPDELHQALQNIEDVYMNYFDDFYNEVKRPDGSNSYTAFQIMGTGKTGKIQCDFGALLSPPQFDEYVLPSLKRQSEQLDNVLFHLDGPECICHVDSLMTVDNIAAIQWTPGARNPFEGDECWDDLYAKIRAADKGLWLGMGGYPFEEAVARADRLVKKFGAKGFYFHFPTMTPEQADALLLKAEREWKD